MLVMSILRMVGAARPRMSFGTGVWVISRTGACCAPARRRRMRCGGRRHEEIPHFRRSKKIPLFAQRTGKMQIHSKYSADRGKCRDSSAGRHGGSFLLRYGDRVAAPSVCRAVACILLPRPQQLLPVSAAGARVAFAAFLRPLGRGLEKQKAAPASPPFICRWQRSAPLQSSPLPQKVRVLSAKAGENGMPFGKFAKERSNCL